MRGCDETHDAYENTWKCGELKLYFSPSAGGYKKIRKESCDERNITNECENFGADTGINEPYNNI